MLTPRVGVGRFLGFIAIGLLLTYGASAQGQTSAQPNGAAAVKSPPASSGSRDSLWKIFVPFEKLKSLVESPSGTVFLKTEQFEKLWNAAAKAAQNAPDTAALTSASYSATSDDQTLTVRGTLTFHSAEPSWSKLNLDFGQGKLSEIKWLDAGPVATRTPNGVLLALIPMAGTYRGEFEIVYPLETRAGEVKGEVQIPPAPAGSLQVTLNRGGVAITTGENLPVVPLPAAENSSGVKIALGGDSIVHLSWPAAQVAATPDLRMFSSVQSLKLRFAPGKAFLEGKVHLERQRGAWGKLQFSLPKQAKVLDVRSSAISRWDVAVDGERQLVNVELTRGAEEEINVSLLLEFQVQEGVLEDISFSTVGAGRELGYLSVDDAGDLDVSIQERNGLVTIDAQDLPDDLNNFKGQNFRFYSPDYGLRLNLKELQPRVRAESVAILRVSDQEILLTTNYKYLIDQVGIYSTAFKLPAGLEITNVESPDLRDYGVSDDGKQLNVQFQEKQVDELDLTIKGRLKLTEGTSSVDAPTLEPIGVHYEDGQLHILASESLEISTDGTKVVGLTPGTKAIEVESGWREASNWTFNKRPVQIPLTIARKPPRVTAEVGTSIVLKPKFAEVRSTVKYDVAYSGVSTFVIKLPDQPDANVRIEGEGDRNLLKQVAPAGEAVDGWKEWRLQTQREVLGSVSFLVRYDLPVPEAGEAGIVVAVQPPRLLVNPGGTDVPVIASKGEIAVRSDDLWSLAADVEGVDEIDVRELTLLSQDSMLAYRYFESPNPTATPKVGLTLEKLDRKDVVRTIVSRGLVEVVLTYDNFAYYRCRYRISSSERQRLGIKLPDEVEPLYLAVAGKTTLLERSAEGAGNKGFYYINVDRETPTDQEFAIQLTYRARVSPILKRWIGGTVAPELPQIGVTAEGALPAVQEQRLVIWAPEEIELVGSPADFQLVKADATIQPRGREEWLRNQWESWIEVSPAAGADFPVVGRAHRYRGLGNVYSLSVQWWRWSWIVVLITFAFLLAGWVVRKTSWLNRISLVLVVALLMLLVGASDWDLLRHLFYASRLGVLAVILLWGLGEVKRWSLIQRPVAGAFSQTEPKEQIEQTDMTSQATAGETTETPDVEIDTDSSRETKEKDGSGDGGTGSGEENKS